MAGLALARIREVVASTKGAGAAPAVPDAVDVVLVTDALNNEVDGNGCLSTSRPTIGPDTLVRLSIDEPERTPGSLDAWSVRGGCAATGGRVECSRAAVEFILAKDESAKFNPALFYVLGHEISHLVLGHASAALAAQTPSLDSNTRVAAALASCFTESTTLGQEEAADDLSLRALAIEIKEKRSKTRGERTFEGFRGLYSWLLWTAGQSATIERGRRFCDFMNATGAVTVPLYHGDHPRFAARLANIARATGVADIVGVQVSAGIDERWVDEFCSDARQFEARRLDCTQPQASPTYPLPGGGEMQLIHDPASKVRGAQPRGEPLVSDDIVDRFCKPPSRQCEAERSRLAKCRVGGFHECDDLVEAIEQAARQDHGEGNYDFGRQATRDKIKLRYFACLRSDVKACRALAEFAYNGDIDDQTSAQDFVSARKWLMRACELGDSEGCLLAAEISVEHMNIPRIQILGILSRGCKLGDQKQCEGVRIGEESRTNLHRVSGFAFDYPPFEQIGMP